MGYRSNVAIAVIDEHVDKFCELINNIGLPESTRINSEDKISGVYFESIKWDEFFDKEVKDVMDFIRTLEDDEFAFVRVGEDLGDIEIYGNLDDFGIMVTTNIEFDESILEKSDVGN